MTLHSQLNRLAATFAQSVVEAIREVSLEELVAETGGLRGMEVGRMARPGQRGGRRARGESSERIATTGPTRPTRPTRRAANRRLKRRSSADIDKALATVVSLVEKRPKGLRAEQIRSELGMQAKEMPRILGEGLAKRKLRKRGHKRATTYYAM
jgi:hypothetical protein